jgi:hypothetical protein
VLVCYPFVSTTEDKTASTETLSDQEIGSSMIRTPCLHYFSRLLADALIGQPSVFQQAP